MLSIGLMSGTSMDGIDASLLETDGAADLHEVVCCSYEYSDNTKILLKAAEFAISFANGDLDLANEVYLDKLQEYLCVDLLLSVEGIEKKVNDLQDYLYKEYGSQFSLSLAGIISLSTLLHANVVRSLLAKSCKSSPEIQVIGYHGQTMYHNPFRKVSIQVGDGNLLSNLTKIKVVTNFRDNDMHFGGQGAPFAPLYHQALAVRDNKLPVIVVNCGGIANISVITGSATDEVLGFDTGPGNGLLDAFIRKRTHGSESLDMNGQYGLLGNVCEDVMLALFAKSALVDGENFYTKLAPKSLDIRDLYLISELDALSLEDGAATLAAFTAESIVQSLKQLKQIPIDWVLAGGGFNNPVILRELKSRLHRNFSQDFNFANASELGWNSKSIEAQMVAYLAVRSVQGMPLSLPSITGVAYPVTGGVQHGNFLK